jgi:hypothetical protein
MFLDETVKSYPFFQLFHESSQRVSSQFDEKFQMLIPNIEQINNVWPIDVKILSSIVLVSWRFFALSSYRTLSTIKQQSK